MFEERKTPPHPDHIKLISLDLDGTLLRSDNSISSHTQAVLKKAHAKGIKIVLNSGRMTPAMEAAADQLDFDVYLISYNGGVVSAPRAQGRARLFMRPMLLDVARELVGIAKRRRLQLNYYLDEWVYSEDGEHLRPHIDLYRARTGSPYRFVERIEDHVDRAPLKVLFVVDPAIRDPLEMELRPRFQERATITRTDPEYLEFLHPEVNKGVGLQGLCASLNVDLSEVMAVGDADNDEPAVRMAGWGVGVANAHELVYRVADAITAKDCNHDGVAEAVERYVLGVR